VTVREELLGALEGTPHVVGEERIVEEAAEAIEQAHGETVGRRAQLALAITSTSRDHAMR
jgi:hypothetical protein